MIKNRSKIGKNLILGGPFSQSGPSGLSGISGVLSGVCMDPKGPYFSVLLDPE